MCPTVQIALIRVTETRFVCSRFSIVIHRCNCTFDISCFFFCRFQVQVPSAEKRHAWWRVFYRGAAFPTLARFLLLGNVFMGLCISSLLAV